MDLIGGQRHRAKKPRTTVESRQAILDAERVLIDEDRPEALKAEGVPLEDSLMGILSFPPVSTAGSSSRRLGLCCLLGRVLINSPCPRSH